MLHPAKQVNLMNGTPPEARLVLCILLTTEAGAGDNWRGRELDCVPRGGQLRLGVTRHHKLVVRRVSAPGAAGSS